MSPENAIWSAVVMAALALMAAGVVTTSSRNTTREATPAAPPPESIRTDVPTGRMICEREGKRGCLEWRIYRTVEH